MLVEIYRFRSPPLQKRIDVAHRVQRENTNTGRSKHYRGFIFSKDNPFFRTHINVKNPKRDPCLYSFGVISHDLLGYNLLSPCFA